MTHDSFFICESKLISLYELADYVEVTIPRATLCKFVENSFTSTMKKKKLIQGVSPKLVNLNFE